MHDALIMDLFLQWFTLNKVSLQPGSGWPTVFRNLKGVTVLHCSAPDGRKTAGVPTRSAWHHLRSTPTSLLPEWWLVLLNCADQAGDMCLPATATPGWVYEFGFWLQWSSYVCLVL